MFYLKIYRDAEGWNKKIHQFRNAVIVKPYLAVCQHYNIL